MSRADRNVIKVGFLTEFRTFRLALQNHVFNALSYAASKGYRVHPDAFTVLKGLCVDTDIGTDILRIVQEIIDLKSKKATRIVSSETFGTPAASTSLIVVEDITEILEKAKRTVHKNTRNSSSQPIVDATFTEWQPRMLGAEEQFAAVLSDPTSKINSADGIEGYTALFRSRFEKSMRILSQRPDSKRITKISSARQRIAAGVSVKPLQSIGDLRRAGNGSGHFISRNDGNNNLSPAGAPGNSTLLIAGLLMSRRSYKNGAVDLVLDDQTGTMAAVAMNDELRKQASMLALDQLVMLEIEHSKTSSSPIIKSIISPDIPDHIPSRSKSEAYALLISDLHVGSKYFMESEFLNLLEWLSSPSSSGDYELISKIKFICIGGDLIDGIGIFPDQDKELLETSSSQQMAHAIKLLARIPKRIKVFVIPGNHDPGRRALPQPSLPIDLTNFESVGNPSLVQMNGVKVLMYHGQGLDDLIANTPGLSYSKPADAMRVMLKARHLSPTYGGRTPIAPELEDMMVITEVPDIFHSGHVHVVGVQNYRGTLIVNSGAWQAQTRFQQSMGIVPTPGIAILVNLATLQPFQKSFNLPSVSHQ